MKNHLTALEKRIAALEIALQAQPEQIVNLVFERIKEKKHEEYLHFKQEQEKFRNLPEEEQLKIISKRYGFSKKD